MTAMQDLLLALLTLNVALWSLAWALQNAPALSETAWMRRRRERVTREIGEALTEGIAQGLRAWAEARDA